MKIQGCNILQFKLDFQTHGGSKPDVQYEQMFYFTGSTNAPNHNESI